MGIDNPPAATVSVPLSMLYGGDLPQAVRFTWLQLYGLACRTSSAELQTPPLALKEIARLTGKSASGIYNHLSILRSIGLIQQLNLSDGRIILRLVDEAILSGTEQPTPPDDDQTDQEQGNHFTSETSDDLPSTGSASQPEGHTDPGDRQLEEPFTGICAPEIHDSRFLDSRFQESRFQESGISSSLKYLRDSKNQLKEVKEREDKFQNSRFQESGIADSSIASPHNQGGSPIAIYHELSGLHLNKVQRRMVLRKVSDPALWRASVDHWLGHSWNPLNIPGMLDLYRRGGPAGCRLCSPDSSHSALPGSPPKQDEPVSDSIQKLRRRHGIPPD